MTPEKKPSKRIYRTSDEVTASMLNRRLTTKQLIEIYKNPEFRSLREHLENLLKERDGVPSRDFGRFHKLEDCEQDETVIEEVTVYYDDIDYGRVEGIGEVRRLICNTHQVSSNRFLTTKWGYEREL